MFFYKDFNVNKYIDMKCNIYSWLKLKICSMVTFQPHLFIYSKRVLLPQQ